MPVLQLSICLRIRIHESPSSCRCSRQLSKACRSPVPPLSAATRFRLRERASPERSRQREIARPRVRPARARPFIRPVSGCRRPANAALCCNKVGFCVTQLQFIVVAGSSIPWRHQQRHQSTPKFIRSSPLPKQPHRNTLTEWRREVQKGAAQAE